MTFNGDLLIFILVHLFCLFEFEFVIWATNIQLEQALSLDTALYKKSTHNYY
jgi:hypothetical protein